MRTLLFMTIGVGAAIGLMMPGGKQAPALTRAAPNEPIVLQRSSNGHFYAVAEIGHVPIRFMVDTGASGIALTRDDARLAGVTVDPAAFEVVGTGASGEVRGAFVTLPDVDLAGRHVEDARAAVLDGLTISLLGQSFLQRLKSVEIVGDTMTLR